MLGTTISAFSIFITLRVNSKVKKLLTKEINIKTFRESKERKVNECAEILSLYKSCRGVLDENSYSDLYEIVSFIKQYKDVIVENQKVNLEELNRTVDRLENVKQIYGKNKVEHREILELISFVIDLKTIIKAG